MSHVRALALLSEDGRLISMNQIVQPFGTGTKTRYGIVSRSVRATHDHLRVARLRDQESG